MMEEQKSRLQDLLLCYGVHDDLSVSAIFEGKPDLFINKLTEKTKQPSNNGHKFELECLVYILCEFTTISDYVNDAFINQLVSLIAHCRFGGQALCRLLDTMRLGIDTTHGEHKAPCIPLNYHLSILTALNQCLKADNPTHIRFPGNKDSYLKLSSVQVPYSNAYTMAIWLKMPQKVVNRGFVLYRTRSKSTEIDAIVAAADDGTMNLTIRTNSDKKGKDETRGKILIAPGHWHLVTVTHSSTSSTTGKVVVCVDGHKESEQDLRYPFVDTAEVHESSWIFGLGLNGFIASATMYLDDFSMNMMRLLHSCGPYLPDLTNGVSCPQSSFDTGHVVLGTQVAKGSLAAKACRATPIFSVKANNFIEGVQAPQIVPGKLYPEHVEMVVRTKELDEHLHASLTGGAMAVLNDSWIDAWTEAGGCSLAMYMVWCYCANDRTFYDSSGPLTTTSSHSNNNNNNINSNMNKIDSMLHENSFMDDNMHSLRKMIAIISSLIDSSVELREQLLQQHGFHVLGSCLSMLRADTKKAFVDDKFVLQVVDLTLSLRLDAFKGDGLTAVLQGLIFDFRIWGCCSMSTMQLLLEKLHELVVDGGDQLYRNIGLQRILDIFRLYVVRPANNNNNNNNNNSSNSNVTVLSNDTNEIDHELVGCADAVEKLLFLVMDAAKVFTTKMKGDITLELEVLLRCLEETSNTFIAERLLRLLHTLKLTSKPALVQSLIAIRYHETLVLTLLTRKNFSAEVRKDSLLLLFWLYVEELRDLPTQMLDVRNNLNLVLMSISSTAGTMGSSPRRMRAVSNVSETNLLRYKTLTKQLKEVMHPLEKAWGTVNMIMEVLSRALNDGAWGNNIPSSVFVSSLTAMPKPKSSAYACDRAKSDAINTVLAVLANDLFEVDAWLALPLLPVLLSRTDLNTSQHALMSLNVQLKSYPSQCEGLVSMPDKSWLRPVVSLLCISNLRMSSLQDTHTKAKSTTVLVDNGESTALACTDITVDCIAILLEYKTKNHFRECWSTWNCFQACLKDTCKAYHPNDKVAADKVESKLLKRCVSLVLQRLSKYLIGWNANFITGIANVLNVIDGRNLCGGVSEQLFSVTVNTSTSKADLLDMDFTEAQLPATQTVEEAQVLSFQMDLMDNIRRSADRGALDGNEWRLLRVSLRITLRCLSKLSVAMADRASNEIMSMLGYMVEAWAPLTVDDFRNTVREVLMELQVIIQHKDTLVHLKNRYTALVYVIMQFFSAIRHSLSVGGVVSKHVLPTMEALTAIDNIRDIDMIFKLLDVTFRTADPISFEDEGIVDTVDKMFLTAATDYSKGKLIQIGESLLKRKQSILNRARNGSVQSNDSNNNKLSDASQNGSDASAGGAAQSIGDEPLLDLDDYASSRHGADRNATGLMLQPPKASSEMMNALIQSDIFVDMSEVQHDMLDFIDDASQGGVQDDAASPLPDFMNSEDVEHGTVVDNANATSIISPVSPSAVLDDHNKEVNFLNWVTIRQGISVERVDSERARLARSMETLDWSTEAVSKFWKKARRKVESESFCESQRCQWKLGVSHEGPFPSRRRIVLRPRFEGDYATNKTFNAFSSKDSKLQARSGATIDANALMNGAGDELSKALATACAGYIQDVTQREVGLDSQSTHSDSKHGDEPESKHRAPAPGGGWGLVDADGSEEGFGVVGLAADGQPLGHATDDLTGDLSTGISTTTTSDMMGDVKMVEDNLRQGKGVETGPCHSGTRKVGSGTVILEAKVIMITASGNFNGTLSFNGKELFFSSTMEAAHAEETSDGAAVNLVKKLRMRRRRWVLSSVSAIYLRRFRLRDSAIEVFFRRGKHRNVFVDFGHTRENAKQRNDYARALMNAAPNSAFKQLPSMSPYWLVFEHGIQDKWQAGKMSNFDYLMALNTIAGRSYNDLCQYPVMPWVLSDYDSDSIDLSNPAVYRDLSKPMGALNPERLNEFLERFNSFQDNVTTGIPPFMYGSHYSTMVGVVLHFLVRLQPFAALHQEMQNGHFDVPDRLFSSIPRAFKHNTTQLSEVKELIPEFFTTPETFRNVNNFNLGKTQEGELVNDVELPPWAKSAEDFVRINREALESAYVSEHLHEWIDLIFGFKQRGPDAVEACNVFYYLTYYGSVDRFMIKDEALRKATELQIAHFGQIPMQLFRTPHPARKVGRKVLPVPRPLKKSFESGSILWESDSGGKVVGTNASFQKELSYVNSSNDEIRIALEAPCSVVRRKLPTLAVFVAVDRVVCVLESGVLDALKFATSEDAKGALTIAMNSSSVRKASPTTNRDDFVPSSGSMGTSDGGDVISFHTSSDDNDRSAKSAAKTTTNNKHKAADKCRVDSAILPKGEPLVWIEKDIAHFDLLPRVPLPRLPPVSPNESKTSNNNGNRSTNTPQDKHFFDSLFKVMPMPNSSATAVENVASLLQFTKNGHLVITAGHHDGRMCVREIDLKTGGVRSAGDFRAHRKQIVAFATDNIPYGNTDVVASCDVSGMVLVWTVSKVRAGPIASFSYVISRRPQRKFRCEPATDMCCEVSWQMGVVVVVSNTIVTIYSIERDEVLRSFCTLPPDATVSHAAEFDSTTDDAEDFSRGVSAMHPSHEASDNGFATINADGSSVKDYDTGYVEHRGGGTAQFPEFAYTGPKTCLYGKTAAPHLKAATTTPSKTITRRMRLSDLGNVIVHQEHFGYSESLIEYEDQVTHTHFLASYSLAGFRTGVHINDCAVTFLACPDRRDVVVTGHADGSVRFFRAADLFLLYQFSPHLHAVNLSMLLSPARDAYVGSRQSGHGNSGGAATSIVSAAEMQLKMDASPVVHVSVGPNSVCPAVICVTTESGNIYLKALPDFVKWEKNRSPSALAQLASIPLQAVKMQAQQLHNWTTETAGVLAQNAKSFADETLEKMNKNKVVKNFASFFGIGKPQADGDN